jgi:hypothetical protein
MSKLFYGLILGWGLTVAVESTLAGVVQVAFFDPLQWVSAEDPVSGVRLDLFYGRNERVDGLDLGLLNRTKNGGSGLAIGLVGNWGDEVPEPESGVYDGVQCAGGFNGVDRFRGVQVAVGLNWVRDEGAGLQLALFANGVNGSMTGLQVAEVNYVKHRVRGAQLGAGLVTALNWAGDVRGAQINVGILAMNYAGSVHGVQLNIGLGGNHARDVVGAQVGVTLNTARTLRGFQLGLINYAGELRGVQVGLLNLTREGWPAYPLVHARF